MLALEEYYGAKLEEYSSLRSIALTADSRVINEAWTKDFADMTENTERWMLSVDKYVGLVEDAFSHYQSEIDKIE
jgi:hypothetical protein